MPWTMPKNLIQMSVCPYVKGRRNYSAAHPATSPKEHFKWLLAIPFVDIVNSSVSSRQLSRTWMYRSSQNFVCEDSK